MTTEELLEDLRLALADPDGIADPVGMCQAWVELPDAETRYRPLRPLTLRQRRILARAAQGTVTSGELALALEWSGELMRQELILLTAMGLLVREGGNRGTRYALAGRNR